ncbi:MAG: tyrosine recombinase XerC [Clostridiales bacterium]|nr:tyrosine recombinase XerC [Clostridiales bacterium]
MRYEDINSLPPLVIKYLKYLEGALNKSKLTVLEYGSDLRLFFRYLVSKNTKSKKCAQLSEIDISNLDDNFIKSVSLEDAYDFLIYCKNVRNNDSKSRARKVVSIKRFYHYLETHNLISDNKLKFLDSPKISKTLPHFLSLSQAQQLIAAPEGKNKTRDICILTLFLNCGIRLSELINIDISDISFDNKTIRIVGKGNKERIIYLNDSAVNAINEYLKIRPKDGVIDKDALFISNRMTRLSKESVQKMVEKYLNKIGLSNMGFSVHKLRHTAATLMYQYGETDVLELKELLGHENLATTEIYTHINNEQVRLAVEKNPLNTLSPASDKNDLEG